MSPLWRDEIGLFLAPKRIVLARMKRGIRPVNVAERTVAVETGEAHSWDAAIETLDVSLEDPSWHRANLRLIVADNFARYAIVPWSDNLSNEDERIQHARLCMANTFGDVVSQWTVTVSDAPPGSSQVACAIPTALLERIRALAELRDLKIKSVQPQLIAAFNGWRNQLPRGDAWFVTIDEGSLAAAHFTATQWDCVRSVRIGADWEVELKRLQTFGRLARTGGGESRVYVDAPQWLRDKSGSVDHGFEWLNDAPPSPDSGNHFPLLQRLYA